MSKFPDGWVNTLLSEIASIQMGQSPDSRSYNKQGEGLPFFQGKAEFGKLSPVVRKWCTDPKSVAESGDILLSVRAPVGPTNLAVERCCIGRGLAAIQANSPFNQKYLLHHFHNIESWLSQQGTGSTFAGISGDFIRRIEIPVAPLDEQKRIADKLDGLLARVDACRDRLDRVPIILERFRQTVLTAGISGQLTEDWRRNSGGQSDSNHRNISGRLADFADVIDPNPSHRYPPYVGGAIPLLAAEQMSGLNDWDTSSAKLTTLDFYEARKLAHDFLDDDIIFARKGRLGLARNPPSNSRYVFSHTVFIIRSQTDRILPSYLLWFLRQGWCIDWLLLEMNSNAGVPTLGKSVMEHLPITIPDYAEQQEIVQCIENLYAYAEHVESRYQKALARVEQLTPALLSKAFCGELVPQNPNDEPASVLLDRIRAERAAQPDKPKRVITRSKSTMIKMSTESVKEAIPQLPNNTFPFDELHNELSKKLTGDYDLLRDVLFALLDETEPSIMQTFDRETKAMSFIRRHQ